MTHPDPYTRNRELRERGAALPDSANKLTDGGAGHFAYYEHETDGHECYATAAFPDCMDARLRFIQGWRHAQNGHERVTLYETDGTKLLPLDKAKALGWDTYIRVHGPVWWRKRERAW